ncbi:unnamed protein product [Acanthoscelides obtectus]|uniref:ABC transmembrane type-2 domain-containing protein n=1 Tax=Acanthoscelides obtectus TaxID=200917 RepID=A0A9P0PZD3_ACAOB|nr:unnamed protein product [Acanthoscelides obtectus]CAK1622536.1 ABC transporter G family member 20 [Acanthoscelides obtectus]
MLFSGGQQRRVSLAVAVMHAPDLLILDEPTVGVDPILRANIWSYMVQDVKKRNTSIIITTHYIEEATQAHRIGFMRDGQLIAEDSPAQLLSAYGCRHLEDVFLKLAREQQTVEATPKDKHIEKKASSKGVSEGQGSKDKDYGCCGNFLYDVRHFTNPRSFKAIMFRNLLRLVRNFQALLFIFLLPVIQVVLFCYCIGNEPRDLPLAIANNEVEYVSPTETHCTHKLVCSVKNNITHIDEAESLSCRYLEYLETSDSVNLGYYSNVDSCRGAVENGDAWACLHFEENFTQALTFRMHHAIRGQNITDILLEAILEGITLEDTDIKVWLDQSDQQIAYVLHRELQESFKNFTLGMLKDCYVHPNVAKPVVGFQSPPIYGTDRPSFMDFAAPGALLIIVFFLAVAVTSSVLITEKQEGLLDRSYVAGIGPAEILVCHVLTQFIIMLGQTVLVLIVMFAIFQLKCIGNLALVVALTLLQGLCGMSFGFLISAVCTQERDAAQLALGSFYPTLMISGVLWPIEALPWGLRYFALLMPLTLATTAMRSIMLRGWGFGWSDVYLGFIATCAWIMTFLIMTLLFLRLKNK